KKTLKSLYAPTTQSIEFVEVPEMTYLMLDSSGDPRDEENFQAVVSTLYTVAYAIKFALKAHGIDFVVMPTEGLWWVEDLSKLDFDDRTNWLWTMMIVQPDGVTPEIFDTAVAAVRKKKNPARLDEVRLVRYAEGRAAQVLYIGAYADELPTIARLHEEIEAQGYVPTLKHHEIYLSDPRKTAPEKLKTVIRQPVTKK
ncbi:MAG: GyrI-like domain-containing protein, partial [Anaerolineae bacterium]|nr:GyrI-like domain-containing protein [Anaerolineae bacterium]